MKDSTLNLAGLLSPLPISNVIFDDISMDFITGLSPSQSRTVILVIVDRLSKYVHFIALPTNFTTQKVAEVVYGRPLPIVSRYIRDSSTNPVVVASLRQRDEVLAILKANLLHARDCMKSNADKGRREVQFNVGDWMYVRLRPYRQLSVCLQCHTKLSRCFFGPFQIVQRVGAVAYKLAFPPSSKIHPVFHVSVLRKCLGNPYHQITPIDLLDQSSSLVLLPEDVL
uniref:Tf2-1-like SH3-like domain-containing protein n=1 Tax=Nicotiana tabacum TaxID=4097 RepID=A0A1S4DA72_TOBAC|nr:PREDICTED: uncharacterized protein LOC107827676 [Nicotiana tabacum]